MRSSIRDKRSIPTYEERRNTDSLSLWITAAITSVSLHLPIFWYMRSSNDLKPWFPEQSQTAVPIELIEISPLEKSRDTSNSQTLSPETTAPNTPSNDDTEAINSQPSRVSEGETKLENSQLPTQVSPEKTFSTPTIPKDDLPWNRREEVILGQGEPLPKDIPLIPLETPKVGEVADTGADEPVPTPTGEVADTGADEPVPTPTGEVADTGADEPVPTPTGEVADTGGDEGVRMTFTPVNQMEINHLIQKGILTPDGLPDVLATHTGGNTKNLSSSYIFDDSQVEPVELLASLVIDNNGNFQQTEILQIEPVSLRSKKSLYEQVINDTFKNDRFLPAENKDGTKPELSNLFLRITIEPSSSE
jgi:hypothetical protein